MIGDDIGKGYNSLVTYLVYRGGETCKSIVTLGLPLSILFHNDIAHADDDDEADDDKKKKKLMTIKKKKKSI